MVSLLAFYYDNLSLNPADAYIFHVNFVFEKAKINKKEARVDPFKKGKVKIDFLKNLGLLRPLSFIFVPLKHQYIFD